MQPRIRKYTSIFIFTLLVVGTVIGLGRFFWLEILLSKQKQKADEIVRYLGVELMEGEVISQEMYRQIIYKNPQIGYIILSNHRTGYRSGLVNTSALGEGAQEVTEFFRKQGTDQTLTNLILPGEGFPSEYLEVYSVAIHSAASLSKGLPLGLVKVGFLVPGFPFGRGFEKLWWIFCGFIGFLCTVLGIVGIVAGFGKGSLKKEKEIEKIDVGLDALEELEEALEEQPTVEIDELGREWQVFFNGKDLDGWRKRGDVYITEREVGLQPWGSSLVYTGTIVPEKYHYQLRAKKISGPDGFLVLFPVGEKNLLWVVGGWGNTRSEVGGYTQTQTKFEVERFTWYKLEIRVEEAQITGWLNDQEVWKLSRTEIQTSSPDAGFQQGLGVAAWSSFAKYKEIRFLGF